MLEHLEGNRQLKLRSKRLIRSRFLKVNGDNGLQIPPHVDGGRVCKKGNGDGASWRPRGLETGIDRI
jgi:hypothetical protein